jgi:hypothetical protein
MEVQKDRQTQGTLQMRFENQTFTTDVTLDYNQFIGGVIKNCVVYYYGGDFSLSETRMENVRFAMAGAASGALMFLRMIRSLNPQAFEELMSQAPPPPNGPATIN